MGRPDVILVNGPSRAGKTTLCRALQAAIEDPYLVVAFDDFIFMAPPRYYRGADTSRQDENDAFTALGVEMVKTSPPGAPPGRRASATAAIACWAGRAASPACSMPSSTTMSWSTPARCRRPPACRP